MDFMTRYHAFSECMHTVISQKAPFHPEYQAEAKLVGTGFVYIVDQRTPTTSGPLPPEDIIGAFDARDGEVVLGSYRANPRYRIYSDNGLVRLVPGLDECVLEASAEAMRAIAEDPHLSKPVTGL